MMRSCAMVISVFWLVACASPPVEAPLDTSAVSQNPAAAASRPSADNVSDAGVSASPGLAAQTLAPGACGLFLWSLDSPRVFTFFMEAGRPIAQVWLEDEAKPMTLTSSGGGLIGDVPTQQVWALESGQAVFLDLVPGAAIDGGQSIKSARLRSVSPEGWGLAQPLNGVIGCQPVS